MEWFAAAINEAKEIRDDMPIQGTQDVARAIYEKCARIAGPWPGFSLDEYSTDIDRAIVKVRTEIRDIILASAALPQQPQDGEVERLRAVILNIQSLAERGLPIDTAKLASRCRHALSAAPASPRAEASVTFCYVTYKACTASCPTREECAMARIDAAPVAEKRGGK